MPPYNLCTTNWCTATSLIANFQAKCQTTLHINMMKAPNNTLRRLWGEEYSRRNWRPQNGGIDCLTHISSSPAPRSLRRDFAALFRLYNYAALTKTGEGATTTISRKQGGAMKRIFAAAVFALLAANTPARAATPPPTLPATYTPSPAQSRRIQQRPLNIQSSPEQHRPYPEVSQPT